MSWTGSDTAFPTVRIATVVNSMQPSERRVAELIAAEPDVVVELTAQELADRVGVARSTVVRACQTIGYRGFPQLRVALAGELAQQGEDARDYGPGVLGRIKGQIATLAGSLLQITSMLGEEQLERALDTIMGARRLLVLANGLSAPLASDLAMRLTAAGRQADFVADSIGQQIAARQMHPGDACVIISGSGANEASLKVARSAVQAGAGVVALTSFASSPLTAASDTALVVAPATTFRNELEHTSRVPHLVVIEALVEEVTSRLGAPDARANVLQILSDNLSE